MLTEYGVKTDLEPLAFEDIRWLVGTEAQIEGAYFGSGTRLAQDAHGHPVLLSQSKRAVDYIVRRNEAIGFLEAPPHGIAAAV